MPLYMDFHKDLNVIVENAKNAKVADGKIGHKYNVKYHRFRVSEEEDDTILCPKEGPHKESREDVNREAHRNIKSLR